MELKVYERLVLLAILPKEGNFITLKVVRQLREALSFTEEEIKVLNFVQDVEKEKVTWNQAADKPIEIKIGEKATEIVVEALKKLDKEQKLTEQHFGLYEKFVEGNGGTNG
uniref:Uncharacterized protein n=1 Tax=viral metagenome TaxID=1070528 RepID=A0A6M3KQS2_9ZZZZ